MVTELVAHEAIYKRFVDEWGTTSAFTFDNEPFTPPVPSATSSAASWVRVVIRNAASNQSTLGAVGNRRFRREGSVIIQVFVAKDSGRKTADTLARTARGIFEGVTFSDICFTDVENRETGVVDGEWYQVVVEAFFQYDEIK